MRNEEGRISQQNRITAGFPVSGMRFATAAQPFQRLEIILQRLRSLSGSWKSFCNRCKASPAAGNHFAIVAKPFQELEIVLQSLQSPFQELETVLQSLQSLFQRLEKALQSLLLYI